jgi:tripartite ATP-independent transporter DctM subunit
MLTIVGLLFALFLAMNMPVAFALALASAPAYMFGDYMPASVAIERMYAVTQSYPLLAVPFFILGGNLMNTSGITERLLRFARLLTGWMAGGLAQVAVVLSMLMGGICGSAVADAAMEARLLGPAMIKRGYSKGFAACAIAFISVITATIPPSIGLVLFGFVNEVSVGALLIGGVIPGLLMTVVIMGVVAYIARREGYAPEMTERPKLREVLHAGKECFWALMFPVFLLAGFRFGAFTATEAGAIVVVYALFVGLVVHREITWPAFLQAVRHSVHDLGMVMLIIVMAAALGHVIILEQGPQAFSDMLTGFDSPYVTLFVVLAILFVAGMIMEATVNVLLLTPLLLPALVAQGFDPVHVGVVIVILITFGGNTPPVGVIMYTVCGIMKCSFEEFVRVSLPFIWAMIAFFALLSAVPATVTWLPSVLM